MLMQQHLSQQARQQAQNERGMFLPLWQLKPSHLHRQLQSSIHRHQQAALLDFQQLRSVCYLVVRFPQFRV
jgi:hypothetical protein